MLQKYFIVPYHCYYFKIRDKLYITTIQTRSCERDTIILKINSLQIQFLFTIIIQKMEELSEYRLQYVYCLDCLFASALLMCSWSVHGVMVFMVCSCVMVLMVCSWSSFHGVLFCFPFGLHETFKEQYGGRTYLNKL